MRGSLDGDCFREIPRLIDIIPAAISYVIREQLQWHYRENRREQLFNGWNANDLVCFASDLVISVRRYCYDYTRPRSDFLHI